MSSSTGRCHQSRHAFANENLLAFGIPRFFCEFEFYNKWQFKVQIPKNFLIKGPLGQTSVKPGNAKRVQSLVTRMIALIAVSAVLMVKPN
jgi:hypothetical protein